jgi:alkanesulfonate monooxygenase SsuD/methylene tetrahydromethanopterin reductase-like flavin-dependent oxidoreductase (luciferase family)
MDFRKAAKRYAALGKPADVAARIAELQRAGVRNVIVDVVGRPEERDEQLERFAKEVRPLLASGARSEPQASEVERGSGARSEPHASDANSGSRA